MNFSCPGDPGIGFDYEYSLRTWWKGYQVGTHTCRHERAYSHDGSAADESAAALLDINVLPGCPLQPGVYVSLGQLAGKRYTGQSQLV